jgi:hypothetical protein
MIDARVNEVVPANQTAAEIRKRRRCIMMGTQSPVNARLSGPVPNRNASEIDQKVLDADEGNPEVGPSLAAQMRYGFPDRHL